MVLKPVRSSRVTNYTTLLENVPLILRVSLMAMIKLFYGFNVDKLFLIAIIN